MTFRIQTEETVDAAVRRIASEQIDKAVKEINNPSIGRHETVHQVRKRCKKIRGLVRLVRPPLGDLYKSENARYRDAARELSGIRDAGAQLECFEALAETFRAPFADGAFDAIRGELEDRKQRVLREQQDFDVKLENFVEEVEAGKQSARSWELSGTGYRAIEGGLRKTYCRGRRAMEAAYADPSDENFHEWRKRVKYHRYHTRLLRDIWPPVMQPLRKELKQLSDLLGDDHDLAILKQTLLDDPDAFGPKRDLQAFLGLIDRRRAELQAMAGTLGQRVYAEKPKSFVRRLGRYWQAWRDESRRPSPKLVGQS